jgi:hypothetical protein
MKLNHLNLSVTDVPAAHKFLAHYFGPLGANLGDDINRRVDELTTP